jgi:hypothetical protein
VLVKTMRALVFMLPVLGLVLFHLAERCRIRAPALLAATLVYSAVLVTQLETDYFHSAPISPDKYLLADRWYSYLPMAWARYGSGHGVVLGLCDLIHREMPRGGRIGVTTERVFLDGRSISLDLNGDALLDGRPFLYHCFRLFDPEGRYSAQAFLSSDALILYVARNAQYSAFTWREDTGLLAYVPGHWAAPEDIRQILNPAGHLLGYYVPLAHRLSPAELAAGMKACNAPGPRPQDRIDDYLTGTHFSVRQCFALLREWALKRFGPNPAAASDP